VYGLWKCWVTVSMWCPQGATVL